MKRFILLLAFILIGCGFLFAQSRQLSPVVNIKGIFKKEYQGIKKGTPFVLQRVVKLKKAPEQMAVNREGVPQIRVLKSPSPDMLMLGNNCLLISTGMLTTLDTEEELYAVLAREVAHYVLDHAIITVNKNIARARRAEFWGAVVNEVVAATEEYLYERYDYYVPGLIFTCSTGAGQ